MSNQEIKIGKVKGDAFGLGNSGVAAKEIHGGVIQIIINSDDAAETLGKLSRIPTEVMQNQAAGMEGNKISPDSKQLQESINELLDIMKSSSRPGHKINEVQAGDLHLSQVELLLKKAILIKTDADQMYFDKIGDNAPRDGYAAASGPGNFELDMNKILADFDEDAHTAKLQEAYNLLEEANKLDPTNTEVLLHMAQLLIELTPDDPTDEQKLLHRIQNLLSNPKDDTERFRLAQATFLLATTGPQIHQGLLSDARAMFQKLGRNEWVRQCDDLMSHESHRVHSGYQAQGFQPVGNWFVQVSDYLSSSMHLTLHPNGWFEATQQAGIYGTIAQAAGQWVFTPAQQMLQFQGMVNGFQPFMLGIMIQNQQGNIFYGIGTDSYGYTLHKS
jgi:hypothetical protein